MPVGLSFKTAKKSAVKRLSFLPRIGFSIDFMGRQIEYRQAPIPELFYNLYKDGLNKENFVRIVTAQISEIGLDKKSKSDHKEIVEDQ